MFERVVEGEEYPYDEIADSGRIFTYSLAPEFSAKMIGSMNGEEYYVQVNDLYEWYISAYLDGTAPEGEMTFLFDFPEQERSEVYADFWFVTTRIRLNGNGEIEYMEYVYVPWG